MRKNYSYIAILEYDDDGISVFFPDIKEAYTCSNSISEAVKDASEVLKLSLKSRIKDNESIPEPTEFKNLKLTKNQYTILVTVSLGSIIKYDKKTVTIPHDLNIFAEEAGINFSQILQTALREKLANISKEKVVLD
jgi:predicted RNase H-like HicB family nuclease